MLTSRLSDWVVGDASQPREGMGETIEMFGKENNRLDFKALALGELYGALRGSLEA